MKTTFKKCNTCGKEHKEIPVGSRPQYSLDKRKVVGFYWECDCGSTMFKKVDTSFENKYGNIPVID